MIKKLLAGKKLINVGKGEMKIALVIIFVIINGIIRIAIGAMSNSRRNFEEHLICLSMGESADCTPIEESEMPGPAIACAVYLSLIPVIVLLVTCDLRACLQKRIQRKRKTSKNVTSQQAPFLTS